MDNNELLFSKCDFPYHSKSLEAFDNFLKTLLNSRRSQSLKLIGEVMGKSKLNTDNKMSQKSHQRSHTEFQPNSWKPCYSINAGKTRSFKKSNRETAFIFQFGKLILKNWTEFCEHRVFHAAVWLLLLHIFHKFNMEFRIRIKWLIEYMSRYALKHFLIDQLKNS